MLGRMLFPRVVLAGLVAWAAICATAQIPPAPVGASPPASPWPQLESDLPTDPALVQGTLPNGLRYLILPVRFAPPPPPKTERTFITTATFKHGAIAWYWPVPVLTDLREERRCHLLAMMLGDRLRLRLRDEIGATYAPTVGFTHTDGFPSANYFAFYAELDPAKKQRALLILEREVSALRTKGPTADEFERAKQPYLRGLTEDLRTNVYWGATVLNDAQQRPHRFASARTRAADNAAITREEITALTRKHLDPARAFKFSTLPVAPAVAEKR